MLTDRLAKIALTVAAISLGANYLQFLHARALARAHQFEVTRLQIEHRQASMLERAAAFHELVLDTRDGTLYSAHSGIEGDEYRVEYAVRIPQERRQEFEQWMSSAKLPEFSVAARSFSHESALRPVQGGRDGEELFEKFAIAVP
jgi:hypothetical protein